MHSGVNKVGFAALAAILTIALPSARAEIIGDLTFGGSATLTLAGGGTVSFNPNIPPAPGNSMVQVGTGSFSSLQGDTGNVGDISSANQPIDTPLELANFLTFTGSSLSFTLNRVPGGFFSSAACSASPSQVGQVCTPAGTPFNLINSSSNQTFGNIRVTGTFFDRSDGDRGYGTGSFSLIYNSGSLQTLLSTIASGAPVVVGYTAQFNSVATPEPATVASVIPAIGLFLAAAARRKKFSKSAD